MTLGLSHLLYKSTWSLPPYCKSETPTMFWKAPAGWVTCAALGWALGAGT